MGRAGQASRGAALITVLAILVVLGISVTLLMDRLRPDIKAWGREASEMQALYLAESGLAYQLYLEKYSDSADALAGDSAAGADTTASLLEPAAPRDTFAFRLDASLHKPDVRVDRTRAYLDITSTGSHRDAKVTLFARFGKALDDSVFGPALTLENDIPLEPFNRGQVTGELRLKTASPGLSGPGFPTGLSVSGYAAEFVSKKYYALEAALQKMLAAEKAEFGNGEFDPRHPPDFTKQKEIVFNLGKVDIHNDGDETWVLRGPGRIAADQEIRVRGNIRLENVQLLSNRDITFEDTVSGKEISLFSRGSVYFHGRCDLEAEVVAAKDIVLRDHARTGRASVLLSVGQANTAGGDSVNAIRVVNQAVAGGFLIAGGANGRVALGTTANRVEGVVMAHSVWLGGSVHGAVLAHQLLCEATLTRNCMGTGVIDRSRLPGGFVQPLQLGPQEREQYKFTLVEWRRE